MQPHVPQDLERKHMHIGVLVEFSMALMSKLDGINRHSFNSFRLRVGEGHKRTLSLAHTLLVGGCPCPPSAMRFRQTLWCYCKR